MVPSGLRPSAQLNTALASMKHLLIVIVFIVSGCVYRSAPPDNVPFKSTTSLNQLVGVYHNRGIGPVGGPAVYLSALIWGDKPVRHDSIDRIEVKAQGDNTLVVRAMSGGALIRESSFVEGKDFVLDAGMLSVTHGCSFVGEEPGAMVAGTECTKVMFGLDSRGEGKATFKSTVAGVAFLVFPVVGSSTDQIRFARITE